MAAASYVRGKFVCVTVKEWDSFTDREGNPVAGGSSMTAFVYTPHDNELCIIKPKRDQDTKVLVKELEVLGLKFGDDCEIVTGALQSGSYRGIFGIARPAKQ